MKFAFSGRTHHHFSKSLSCVWMNDCYFTAYLTVQYFQSIYNCVLQFHRARYASIRKKKQLVDTQPHRPDYYYHAIFLTTIFFSFSFLSISVSLHIWRFGAYGINHRWQIGCANGDRTNHAVDIFAHFFHHLRARRQRVKHARFLWIENDFPRFGVPFGDPGMRGQLCQHACIWIGTCSDLHPYGRAHYKEIWFGPCASSRHCRLRNSIAAIVQSK